MIRPTAEDIQGHLSDKETTCMWLFQKQNSHNLLWFLKMYLFSVDLCMYVGVCKTVKEKERNKVES